MYHTLLFSFFKYFLYIFLFWYFVVLLGVHSSPWMLALSCTVRVHNRSQIHSTALALVGFRSEGPTFRISLWLSGRENCLLINRS